MNDVTEKMGEMLRLAEEIRQQHWQRDHKAILLAVIEQRFNAAKATESDYIEARRSLEKTEAALSTLRRRQASLNVS